MIIFKTTTNENHFFVFVLVQTLRSFCTDKRKRRSVFVSKYLYLYSYLNTYKIHFSVYVLYNYQYLYKKQILLFCTVKKNDGLVFARKLPGTRYSSSKCTIVQVPVQVPVSGRRRKPTLPRFSAIVLVVQVQLYENHFFILYVRKQKRRGLYKYYQVLRKPVRIGSILERTSTPYIGSCHWFFCLIFFCC